MSTNPTENQIETASVADLAALSASDLALLQARLGEERKALTARTEKLNAAIERRYLLAARAAYLAAQKDTGCVHVPEDGFDVEVTTSKEVKWDQAALAAILDTLPAETARHFAKVEITIEERKFAAAPPDIQARLAPARTVKPGRMRFALTPSEEKEAA